MKRLPLLVLLIVTLAAACGSKDTTARASGIPSTTTTTGVLTAETKVLADCTSFGIRPKQIVIACADANLIADDLTWPTWTADSAQGSATMQVNPCEPNCAADTQRPFAAEVELDKPVDGTFSEVVVTWTGTPPFGHPTDTYSLPTEPLRP